MIGKLGGSFIVIHCSSVTGSRFKSIVNRKQEIKTCLSPRALPHLPTDLDRFRQKRCKRGSLFFDGIPFQPVASQVYHS